MINEDVIREITDSWSFQTNLHIVANSLHISDTEAQSLLLDECLKRHVETPLTAVMQWKVTYARKDLVSQYYRNQKRDKGLKEKLKVRAAPRSIQQQLEDLGYTEKDVKNVIGLAFSNRKTREFAESILLKGESETMAQFKVTHRQFQRKLKRLVRYSEEHREHFREILAQYGRIRYEDNDVNNDELAILRDYQLIINNRSSPETLIEELIQNNQEYFEDLIGRIPNIDECGLLRHYCMTNRKDMYQLNEAINTRLEELENKLQSLPTFGQEK